jgi:hypothetical protein
MGNGYELLLMGRLESVLRAFDHFDFIVAIQFWLIEQLTVELKDQIAGTQIEIIRVAKGDHGSPGFAIHYDNPAESPDIGPLVEETIARLLDERPIVELIDFLEKSKTDWQAVSSRIMTDVR